MSNSKWDNNYLKMARLVSEWSKDPAGQVGAVIVRKNRVVATGFNGFPTEVEDLDERLRDKKIKLEMVVHAEQNALIVAGKMAEGATIYIFGKPVCSTCAGAIIQAQIERVVGPDPAVEDNPVWREKGEIARQMFTEAHVIFHPRTVEEELEPANDLVSLAAE